MFTFRKGKTAAAFQQAGHEFRPDLHWTGSSRDAQTVTAVQGVIDQHIDGLVAFFCCEPSPGSYSIELQFLNPETARCCDQAYRGLFDQSGHLKK